jgi:hypothetical protein
MPHIIITRYVLRAADGRYYLGHMNANHTPRYTDNPWSAFHRSTQDSVISASGFGWIRGNHMIQAGQLSVEKIEREI